MPNAELEIVETALRERANQYGPNPEAGVFDPYTQRLAGALVAVCVTTCSSMRTGGTSPGIPTEASSSGDLPRG